MQITCIVVWDIFVIKNFGMLKVRVEIFSYNSFGSKIFQDKFDCLEFFGELYIKKKEELEARA